MRKNTFVLLSAAFLTFGSPVAFAQNAAKHAQADESEIKLKKQVDDFLLRYKPRNGDALPSTPRLVDYKIDDLARTVTLNLSDNFAAQTLTAADASSINKKLGRSLPRPFNKYKLRIVAAGMPIEQLVVPRPASNTGQWGKINYTGQPWVSNTSRPNDITHGLQNRHIALWASHGRYYEASKSQWKWQRPSLYCTTEDLFTQTIVVPYLMPMLQNAGAVVFSPRERDWQKNEVIVDNDTPKHYYIEQGDDWHRAPFKGFAIHQGTYTDGENPFTQGTARMTATKTKRKNLSYATYQPAIPEAGRYAVYVSYQTVEGSIPDAEYTVYHKGQATTFRVNQQMGGGTWVYLGTFDFDRGCNEFNRVELSNNSSIRGGIVTTDAVRFGGGMGNIERGGTTSQLPRCLEGARYYAQWAGAPYSVYGGKNGVDDYGDDINTRSLMTNWLAGGSPYVPATEGKNVPIELSLAVHSDAGYSMVKNDIIGSLAICTTNFNERRLGSGVSRMMSYDFADSLLTCTYRDIKARYGRWNKRYLWDRNYSETRCPEVPSAIIETLSHQNFADMRMAHDPDFKFTLARSLYKTILRYISAQHGTPCIVQPLAPDNFRAETSADGRIALSWTSTTDPQEPTAVATAYNVYVAEGSGDFDNGHEVTSTHFEMKAEEGVRYSFRVTAVNRGGESFPTEVLSATYSGSGAKNILIVNGFHRLAGPAPIDNGVSQGFDLDADMGVQRGMFAGWSGRQQCFDTSRAGREGPGALGYSGGEMAGSFVDGNEFCYVAEHAEAIGTGKYNISSCSSKAIEAGLIDISRYACADLILGLERNDGYSLGHFKTLRPTLRKKIEAFALSGGRLIVSGAYVGSDMTDNGERSWMNRILKTDYACPDSAGAEQISGLGTAFAIHRTPCAKHYAAPHTDVLSPTGGAWCAMQYADGTSAAVAYGGNDYKCFTMGFPLECIKDRRTMRSIMGGILKFVME